MIEPIVELTSALVHCQTTLDRPDELWRAMQLVRLWWQENLAAEARDTMTIWGEEGESLPLALIHPPGDLDPPVLLHAHLDVVDAPAVQFRPRVEGDRLYGRGSADMKGAAATIIHLAAEQVLQGPRFGVLLTFNEEVGGRSGRGTESYFRDESPSCRFFLSGERSNLRIAHRSKGVMRLRLTVSGRSAHAATPWDADNALQRLINGLAQLPSPGAPEEPSLTLTSIETDGDAFNVVPGTASAGLDARFTTPDERQMVLDRLKGATPEGELQIILDEPGASCAEDNPVLVKLREAVEASGIAPVLYTKPHASDVRLANAAGTPGVVFGPEGGNPHGEDEWVSIPSLSSYRAALEAFLKSLDS